MITVCGEGLMDLVPTSPSPLSPLQPAVGGGPFNVAVAAARLGAPTRFISRLSTDAFGSALMQRLQEEGVDTQYVERGPEPTTLAVTTLDAAGNATYTFYLEGTADRFVSPPHEVDTAVAYFGTCSLALEPGASRYADFLHRLSVRGTLIALDPNIREFMETPEHREFLRNLLPQVSVLKCAAWEREFLGDIDVPVCIVTNGAAGLYVETRGMRIDVPAVPVFVADTIGAGDTIMGAILARLALWDPHPIGLLEQLTADDWRDILQYAATAAAITCLRVGAQPPTHDEVQAFAHSF